MIRQEILIRAYDWRVRCYYSVDTYYTEEIAQHLQTVGCGGDYLRRAVANMDSGKLNHGLCYSNTDTGESVLVVGLTSSAAQFLNSLCHELHHLTEHICKARGVPTDSEEAAYLCGDMAQKIFPCVVNLLCEHCRKHNHNTDGRKINYGR